MGEMIPCMCGAPMAVSNALCGDCYDAKEVAYQVCRALDVNDYFQVEAARQAALMYRQGIMVPIRGGDNG